MLSDTGSGVCHGSQWLTAGVPVVHRDEHEWLLHRLREAEGPAQDAAHFHKEDVGTASSLSLHF